MHFFLNGLLTVALFVCAQDTNTTEPAKADQPAPAASAPASGGEAPAAVGSEAAPAVTAPQASEQPAEATQPTPNPAPAPATDADPAKADAPAAENAKSGDTPAAVNPVGAAATDSTTTDPAKSDTAASDDGKTDDSTVSEDAGGSGWRGLLIFLGVFAVVILPFVFGQMLANSLKVKDWGMRFGISLFALVLGLAPFVAALIGGKPMNEVIRLGIDLKGGTNMVFQVKGEGKTITNEVMDKMVGAVGKRINPSGTEEITVRQVGQDRIEVIVPGEDPQTVDEIKRRIIDLGSLEFFVAADFSDHRDIVQQGLAMGKELNELYDSAGNLIAVWRPAFEKNNEPQLLTGQGLVSRTVEKIRSENGKATKYNTEEYLLIADPPAQRVTGDYLVSATPGYGQSGQVIVNFRFNQRGGFLFQQLTSANLPKPGGAKSKLAIVLNRQVYSAPSINSVISDQGMIEGNFSQEEAQELSDVLNAGALEVPIDPKPLSEATVDPTLGADVRQKGVSSVLIGGVAVILFMLFYYRFAGVVAVSLLVLNILLVMGSMVLINATFTLPGLAGIVLVIGMAVDANVLIYERLREELNRGSSLRMAIHNGFEKAFSTIVDSNVTTLLTAVVLFMIGTDAIKGFAVTLFIGITMSMFTACYVGRLIFDVAERRRWITTLNMLAIVRNTKLDFLGLRWICGAISLTLIAGGMVAFMIRGDKNYDIDFTGGTMVAFQLQEEAPTEEVRRTLATQFTEGFTLERLSMADEKTEGIGRHFRLRTTESDSGDATSTETESAEDRVRHKVYEAFRQEPSMHLRMVTMEAGEVVPIAVDAADESAEAISLKRFAGGVHAPITLSDEVAAGTVTDKLTRSLARLKDGDQPKYANATSMIELVGLEGSGLSAAEREVRKYSKLDVRAMAGISADDLKTALTAMSNEMAASPLFDEVNTFASSVASEMVNSAILAIVISMLIIVAYIWFRFQNVDFGIAAVAALIHDVLIVMGSLALVSWIYGTPIGDLLLITDLRINLPMVAAFLTLVGYSLNDTIVVFDRIREIRGKNPEINVAMVNSALNQTLSRTLLTSFTTWIVVIILYSLGGEGIHGFAYCLLIGIFVGTYSSIYVASPVLLWLMNRKSKTLKRI